MSGVRVVGGLVLLALFGALGRTDSRRAAADGPLYEATGMVIEQDGEPPELCLGMIAASRPPQCGGPRLEGWSWDEIEREESAVGVTWGDAQVIGSYDGDTITVVAAGPPQRHRPAEEPDFSSCPEPAGGWSAVDPARASERDLDRAAAIAEREPDFAGVWVDYYDGHRLILNLGFTGALGRHRRDLRELWGGPLCLVPRRHTYEELDAIQREVADAAGGKLLSSYVEPVEGIVGIDVIVLDEATKAAIARYGEGVVRVDQALEELE